ncbi:MAG: hypothetical protein ACK5KR_01895, partial [Breznakia sp.]
MDFQKMLKRMKRKLKEIVINIKKVVMTSILPALRNHADEMKKDAKAGAIALAPKIEIVSVKIMNEAKKYSLVLLQAIR